MQSKCLWRVHLGDEYLNEVVDEESKFHGGNEYLDEVVNQESSVHRVAEYYITSMLDYLT